MTDGISSDGLESMGLSRAGGQAVVDGRGAGEGRERGGQAAMNATCDDESDVSWDECATEGWAGGSQ